MEAQNRASRLFGSSQLDEGVFVTNCEGSLLVKHGQTTLFVLQHGILACHTAHCDGDLISAFNAVSQSKGPAWPAFGPLHGQVTVCFRE